MGTYIIFIDSVFLFFLSLFILIQARKIVNDSKHCDNAVYKLEINILGHLLPIVFFSHL